MTEAHKILPIMLGTAGHVDHGKSSLVRALTGFDPEKHPEEKLRGMTIDMSVAPFLLSNGSKVGIIDVPGHEDFIRNMVAGASSVDLLILVVAADDGIMPQTREHLTIATLLGARNVVPVVNKADLVDAARVSEVKKEVTELLSGCGVPFHPPLVVAATVGQGIPELKAVLEAEISKINIARDGRAFRVDVRAAFTAKGFGTIVTGVPKCGAIAVGETVELLPAHTPFVVRHIQTYRQETGSTIPHISTALNLRDATPEQFERGMTLAWPEVYDAHETCLLHLKLLQPQKKTRLPAIIHIGTGRAVARIRLFEADALNHETFAFARFDRPLVLTAGDRFILRSVSENQTLGGGTVVATRIGRPRKATEAIKERLASALKFLNEGDYTRSELTARANAIITRGDLVQACQLPKEQANSKITDLQNSGFIAPLAADIWVILNRINEVGLVASRLAARYHHRNPVAWGCKPEYLCELLGAPSVSFNALWAHLKSTGYLALKHGRIALPNFEPKINARLLKLKDTAFNLITKAGITSIAKGDLQKQLQIPDKDFRSVLELLTASEEIIVLDGSILSFSLFSECREKLLALFKDNSVVDLPSFRSATGASRNVATLILDKLDAIGLTKRVEKGRVLVNR